ncbi:MAG: hypothetical protein A2W23_02050 [Planctomycetes bacterium RBG_16_43_13]|nr:MAG: hypothetical protein A2W23_02050 [Planctomycetes bacterium RBG_16_43_13]
MSKEKRHRYQTAKEMAIDLCRFNEGRDILAKPPGISTKVVTKIKRHKVFTAITSMLIVALTIFLLYRSVFVNPLEKIAEETTATLSITTDPLNVDITIIAPNIATLKGKTPFTDKVKIGYYTLMLKKDGYPYFFMPISVERNIASTVKLRLYREEEIPENMVYIPAGEFPMDNPAHVGDINLGLHKVFVKPFFIDKYEVTNAQYKLFIDATNHKPPQSWKDGKIPKGKELFPVTDVIYNDALSYASWAGKRLPTEEEWEKAARGIDGRIYPWGNKFISKNLNYSAKEQSILSKLRSVGSYPEGVSPYGCYDMAGNAAEWTISQDKWGKFKLRGGSYLDVPEFCTTYTSILLSSSENTSKGIGFRCVKDAPE